MSGVYRKRRKKPELNLVPLIDVLVMLIFFAFVTMQFKSAATLNISWSAVPSPASTDWVALYCVGDPLANWIEWDYVSVSPGWASGSGAISFWTPRTSACDELEFRLYRDPSPYTLLGTSNAISWAGGGGGPFQHRVAYGAEPQTAMTVSWTDSALDTRAVLMLGTASGVYNLGNFSPALGSPLSYQANETCTAPANQPGPDSWTFPGYFYHVPLTGLTPNTRYFASAVSSGVSSASELTFMTGKPTGAGVATRFALYGDMSESGVPGAVETSQRLTERVNGANDLDFLVHIGDLSYAEGHVSIWNVWMGLSEERTASRARFMHAACCSPRSEPAPSLQSSPTRPSCPITSQSATTSE